MEDKDIPRIVEQKLAEGFRLLEPGIYKGTNSGIESVTIFTEAVELDPHCYTGLIALAEGHIGLYHSHRYPEDQTIALLHRAQEIAPNDTKPYYLLGKLYSIIGHYGDASRYPNACEESSQYFLKALELGYPKKADLYNFIVLNYFKAQKYDEALSYCERTYQYLVESKKVLSYSERYHNFPESREAPTTPSFMEMCIVGAEIQERRKNYEAALEWCARVKELPHYSYDKDRVNYVAKRIKKALAKWTAKNSQ